jgi:hypothetical protein
MKTSFVLPLLYFGVASNAPIVMAQSAGTSTPIGNMTSARQGHTATLLTNGSVLITGGCFPTFDVRVAYCAPAELYDPSTRIFTATGDMATAR